MEQFISVFAGVIGGVLSMIVKSYIDKKQETNSITKKEKIVLYKEISEPIIELVVNININNGLTSEILIPFEKKRLSITAQLALFAPQNVFDDYNALIDYLYNSFDGKDVYSFIEFRKYAMKFLSSMRKDIGIYKNEITYNGNR
ncbi:MAG: hypothetical protein Q7U69_00510 [Sulfuricurvum sp.]|uniref:hypothetical protein n=1 Tax=Sulfuricurvum sp. TaxID=2025608 RepID=UPI00271DB7A4|nr:hypothetical protein [Sulfuricurvum sp.]MDO9055008.1 hypothetical protein [Sulfuricurvum sp.]